MAIYAYSDETIIQLDANNQNSQGLGTGLFIVKEEINQTIIDEALTNLRKDKDPLNKQDKRVLQRGYFHASDDGPSAHSHLCEVIRKYSKGVFNFIFYDQFDSKSYNTKAKEKILDRCLNSSTIPFFNQMEEIIVQIEGRQDLKNLYLNRWKKRLYYLFDKSSENLPSFKTYYPSINIIFGDKKTPGIQITDFLLWATARTKKFPPDNIWFSRIKIPVSTWHDHENYRTSEYYINTTDVQAPDNYPIPFQKAKSLDDIMQGWLTIERFFNQMDKTDFPKHTMHLLYDCAPISNLPKEHILTSEILSKMAISYFRLFDSVPIYKSLSDHDIAGWSKLMQAKDVAVRFWDLRQIHVVRTQAEYLRTRADLLKSHLSL